MPKMGSLVLSQKKTLDFIQAVASFSDFKHVWIVFSYLCILYIVCSSAPGLTISAILQNLLQLIQLITRSPGHLHGEVISPSKTSIPTLQDVQDRAQHMNNLQNSFVKLQGIPVYHKYTSIFTSKDTSPELQLGCPAKNNPIQSSAPEISALFHPHSSWPIQAVFHSSGDQPN